MNKPTLNRQSNTPLYRQLANLLEREIRGGARPSGAKLPSEKDLRLEYRVSRHVVRTALDKLTKGGLISKKHGTGSFVSPQKIAKPIATLTSYRASMNEHGFNPELRLLRSEIVAAPRRVAEWLGVEVGAPVISLERLACIDGQPASMLEAVLPGLLFPGLLDVDFTEKSLYATLEQRYGVRVARSHAYIEAVIASEREAKIMETRAGTILMVLEGVVYDQHERPVEYSRVTHRNDRFKFSIESFARDGSPPAASAAPSLQAR